MDLLQKQKIMMLVVVIVLTATAVFFYSERMKVTEMDKNYSRMSPDDIHRQELPLDSSEYKILSKNLDRFYMYKKNAKISEKGNITMFYSLHNEQPITTTFWLSNLECNDGTNFLNPKFDSFENMVLMPNNTKVFPLRIYYPKIKLTGPSSYSCRIHISSGLSEYAVESFVLILEPRVTS